MYKQNQQEPTVAKAADNTANKEANTKSDSENNEDVVDADFEEVKDDKEKKRN